MNFSMPSGIGFNGWVPFKEIIFRAGNTSVVLPPTSSSCKIRAIHVAIASDK